MQKIGKWLSLGFLTLVVGWIIVVNFPAGGEWMTGWDNLHPEFNFGVNFRRGLFSVWQEFQGLGTFGGHGYAATLLHTVFLWIMSWVLPLSKLRAVFNLLMLYVGAVGAFGLVRWLLGNDKRQDMGALVAAFYYVSNLATVQNFYIPLEAFTVHFAALPWLLWSLFRYLRRPNKKHLVGFGAVSFLSSIQGFIPPLFMVTGIFVGVILVNYWLLKKSFKRFKRAFVVMGLMLAVNAYWLLPVGYYSLTRSQNYLQAYNNLRSTGWFMNVSKKYGGVKDVALLKGFIFETKDTLTSGETEHVLTAWREHLGNKQVEYIGYGLFGLMVLGLIQTLKNKRRVEWRSVAVLFVVGFLILSTGSFLGFVPMFKQAFRVPFTKFSLSLGLMFGLMLAYGVVRLMKAVRMRFLGWLVAVMVVLGIGYFSRPIFEGNFIYPRTRKEIPQAYFDMFRFFEGQDSQARVANFPQGWNWGWSIYKWEYSGSGFLWYGLEQPVMDRAFDVWGKANENYYWEMIRAVMAEDYEMIEEVLEKYQVDWIVFDPNIFAYPHPRESLYLDRVQEYLDGSDEYWLQEVFDSEGMVRGGIRVYKVNRKGRDEKFVSVHSGLPRIEKEGEYNDWDQAYIDYGMYLSVEESKGDVEYVYENLFSKRREEERLFKVESLPLKEDEVVYDSGVNGWSGLRSGECQIEKVEGGLRFETENTRMCVSLVFDNLSQNEGYLVKVLSKSLKGKLSLSVVNHQTGLRDVEVGLFEGRELGDSYVILPPMNQYGRGYTLAFENVVDERSEAISELALVKIWQIPYKQLKQMRTVRGGVSSGARVEKVSVEHPNESLYRVRLEGVGSGEKTLVLSQAFDKGWLAYEKLGRFRYKRLKDHVLVNNWANGWVLPENVSDEIAIYFWPQILEFIGFGILVGGGVWLGVRKKEKRERKAAGDNERVV